MNNTTTPKQPAPRHAPRKQGKKDTRRTLAVNLVGMDAHSQKIVLCLTHWQHGSDPVVIKTIATTLDAMQTTYANNIPPDAITVLEATTNAFSITRKLNAAGHPNAKVLAAETLAGFARSDRVNDNIDAHNLAIAYARGGTREVFVPSEHHTHLRDLFYGYHGAVRCATRASNHIWSFCSGHGFNLPPAQRKQKAADIKAQLDAHAWDEDARFHIGRLLADYAHAVENRELYRQRIERTVYQTPDMLRIMQVLGLSVQSAFGLFTFLEDVTRFESGKKLASYFGFNPVVCTSGESSGPRRLSRFGQRQVKSLLVEAAHSALRHGHAPMHVWARRKIVMGKPRNVMLCALARKMLVTVWHILMGHPVPGGEATKSYTCKLAKLACSLRKSQPEVMKGESAAAFIDRVCAVVFAGASSAKSSIPPSELRTIPPASA